MGPFHILRNSGGPDPGGPVLVSVTDFHVPRMRDMLSIAREGLLLTRAWDRRPGALGLWLWTLPMQRRLGSVSVWTDAEALRAFLGSPEHLAVVRAYRDAGKVASHSWEEPRYARGAIWSQARRKL